MREFKLNFHTEEQMACLREYKMLYIAFQLVLHQFHHRIQIPPSFHHHTLVALYNLQNMSHFRMVQYKTKNNLFVDLEPSYQ